MQHASAKALMVTMIHIDPDSLRLMDAKAWPCSICSLGKGAPEMQVLVHVGLHIGYIDLWPAQPYLFVGADKYMHL